MYTRIGQSIVGNGEKRHYKTLSDAITVMKALTRVNKAKDYGSVASKARQLVIDSVKSLLYNELPENDYPGTEDEAGDLLNQEIEQMAEEAGDAVERVLQDSLRKSITKADIDDDEREALEAIEFTYHSHGPDNTKLREESEAALSVEVSNGAVTFREWTDIEAATGDKQPEEMRYDMQSGEMSLEDMFSTPSPRWAGVYSRDDADIDIHKLLILKDKAQKEAIITRAISAIAYGEGIDGQYVSGMGETDVHKAYKSVAKGNLSKRGMLDYGPETQTPSWRGQITPPNPEASNLAERYGSGDYTQTATGTSNVGPYRQGYPSSLPNTDAQGNRLAHYVVPGRESPGVSRGQGWDSGAVSVGYGTGGIGSNATGSGGNSSITSYNAAITNPSQPGQMSGTPQSVGSGTYSASSQASPPSSATTGPAPGIDAGPATAPSASAFPSSTGLSTPFQSWESKHLPAGRRVREGAEAEDLIRRAERAARVVGTQRARTAKADSSPLGTWGVTPGSSGGMDMIPPKSPIILDADKELYASFNRFEISLTQEQVDSVPRQGPADDAIEALVEEPSISDQLDKIDPEEIRAELKETGGWDEEELADDEENRRRILWIGVGNVQEEGDDGEDEQENGEED